MTTFAVVLAGTALSLCGCDRLIPTHQNKTQVDMAKVDHPTNMPNADKQDAVVVTVMRTGVVFLGQDKTSVDELGALVRDRLADKPDNAIYVRADARAQYRAVEDAIDAVRSTGAHDVGLLTEKKGGAEQKNYIACSRAPAASMGLEVSVPSLVGASQQPSDRTIVVQVLYRPGADPGYRINETDVTKAELLEKLTEIFASRAERVIFVTSDDDVDFHYVAEVIDIAKAAGVDHIGLLTPHVEADFAPSFPPIAPIAIPPQMMIVPENHEVSPSSLFGASKSDTGGTSKLEVKAAAPQKVNVSAGVAEGMLLEKTQPIYPPIAKAARVQGTVVLYVTISKTGAVESLRVISGPALLQQSALDTVKTWRYRPYLLNNEPVEVETTVNVIFTLSE